MRLPKSALGAGRALGAYLVGRAAEVIVDIQLLTTIRAARTLCFVVGRRCLAGLTHGSKGGALMRIVGFMAYLIEIALGALLIVIDRGGIEVGPLPGSEPLSPMFTVVGVALVLGGLGGLVSQGPSPFRPR